MKFAIPGAQPQLSYAELEALDPKIAFEKIGETCFLFEPARAFSEICDRAAGIVKAGEIFGEYPVFDQETLAPILASTLSDRTDRVSFGISLYKIDPHVSLSQKQIRTLGMEIKKSLKAMEIPCRFVEGKEPALSSVIVQTNHLLERGAEFVIIAEKDRVRIGQTTFVQDFKDWSHRDYGRPERSAKSGMLPPKLARLMVNLARKEPSESSLWDPFCGSGTILTEAGLMGFSTLVGTDVREAAIKETKKNVSWTSQESHVTFSVAATVHDATSMWEGMPKQFDAIVAEGYLGPPQKGGESQQDLKRVRKELSDLYTRAIPILLSSLKKDGVLILALPCFAQAAEVYVGLPKEITERISPLQTPFPNKQSPRGGLLYRRPTQFVGREILRWKK